jgi:hypothetical protein
LRVFNDTNGAIDEFEEVMEAFDMLSRYLDKLDICRVAEYLCEEVHPLFLVE